MAVGPVHVQALLDLPAAHNMVVAHDDMALPNLHLAPQSEPHRDGLARSSAIVAMLRHLLVGVGEGEQAGRVGMGERAG